MLCGPQEKEDKKRKRETEKQEGRDKQKLRKQQHGIDDLLLAADPTLHVPTLQGPLSPLSPTGVAQDQSPGAVLSPVASPAPRPVPAPIPSSVFLTLLSEHHPASKTGDAATGALEAGAVTGADVGPPNVAFGDVMELFVLCQDFYHLTKTPKVSRLLCPCASCGLWPT